MHGVYGDLMHQTHLPKEGGRGVGLIGGVEGLSWWVPQYTLLWAPQYAPLWVVQSLARFHHLTPHPQYLPQQVVVGCHPPYQRWEVYHEDLCL